jgi:5-oxoprolinase (ATP-hydrolysing) subunit A
MLHCDINCDMGEGIGNDEIIMHFISSANIACGFHAGDDVTMNNSVLLAKKHGVVVGAHPSFFDRKNFGRTEMKLSVEEIYELVQKQMKILKSVAAKYDVLLQHVKPHGALYNMSAKEPAIAQAIAVAIKDYDANLILFGLSGSHSIKEAVKLGLKTKSEVFADRTYQDDGNLTPRSKSNALIHDTSDAVGQALQMVLKKAVTTVSGKTIPVVADTVCIHGDSAHAVAFAKAIHAALSK